MATLRLLIALSIRNIFSHKIKSLIVGAIIFFGTFLVVLGTSLLDSVKTSMSQGITSSLAGHLQIYDADAKDELALFGGEFMGAEDIGRIDDFSKLRTALESVPNVEAVVPMGIDMASVTSPGELDRALGELRRAVHSEDRRSFGALQVQIREIIAQMQEERRNNFEISRDKEKLQEELDLLQRANADELWAGFADDPLGTLEFLDTKIAPLATEGRLIYFRYVGTDLERFADEFQRFEIVRGKMVPPKKRGFLFNQKYYEDWIKHYVARKLDQIHRAVTKEGKTILGDPVLQALARQSARQYRRITYQLEPDEAAALEKELREVLPEVKGDLNQLLQSFLAVTDENIEERYRQFYELVAPKIDLYDVDIGDFMTVRAFTRSGYLKAVNVKVYGTFQFKGLETSDIAGGHNIMDIMTFRELYGLMTKEKLAELDSIREEIGLEDVGADDAEDELFGGEGTVEVSASEGGFDEFAGLSLSDEAERLAALQDATMTQAEIDSGLALNAAVILKDPGKIQQTTAQLEASMKEAGLNMQIVDWQTASGIVGQFIYVIQVVLFTAIFIIFTVAVVIINNSMIMATMERVTEIGTMRAIGAGRRLVLIMFLLETVVLSIVAGGLGALAAAGLIGFLQGYGIPAPHDVLVFLFGGPRLYPSVGLSNLIIGIVVILVVSVLSTAYPAGMATQIQPVMAMRAKE